MEDFINILALCLLLGTGALITIIVLTVYLEFFLD
jgi:hypothetical protein